MSLLDLKKHSRRVLTGLTLSLAAGGLLAGCQVRPLYGSLDTAGTTLSVSVQAELAAIDIDPIGDGVSERTLYNELIYKFERGAAAPEKRYRLRILMNQNTASVGVEQLADVPSALTLTMNTTFVLTDLDSEKSLMTGRAFGTASYDFSNQRFANLRASRDAEERVAKAVAEDIQARIAGYFASRR